MDRATPATPSSMSTELVRIYRLPTRWLAEEILRLARRTREQFSDRLPAANRNVNYECSLVWDVVPEVAKRLGSRSLGPLEACDPRVSGCDNFILREYAGICLTFSSLRRWVNQSAEDLSAAAILLHDITEGNPVAIALDRLQPPDNSTSHQDLIVRQMRQWSRARGLRETAAWRPDLES